jgi:hypothetical protein
MNRFDIQRRPSFSGGPLLPSICAAYHPLTRFDDLPILPGRASLILAVSPLVKGSSQVVDAQKLTASRNTDKSRFLTLCYALATMLDVLRFLMQPHFHRVSRPKKRLLSPRFLHDRTSKTTALGKYPRAEFYFRDKPAKRSRRPGFLDSSASLFPGREVLP